MLVSTRWLSRYLDPGKLGPEEIQRALIDAGFPIESSEVLSDGDARLDVEITSNRGDCLAHAGLAREIAAKTGRRFVLPTVSSLAGAGSRDPAPCSGLVQIDNREPAACPRFTARVIRGVKIGPSPAWLATMLEAAGQRSINNVVDATNFANLELGQPCHAFDLNALAKGADGRVRIVVRFAHAGETLRTLDGKDRSLRADELVVGDELRARGLAGVMGGADSEVTDATTDVLLEVATWDPVVVRRASRRHQLRTDASHRYERVVDARAIDANAQRIAELVAAVSGGRLLDGFVAAGPPVPAPTMIALRPARVRAILGADLPDERIAGALGALGIEVAPAGRAAAAWTCRVPDDRPDLTREIDLIEEVARVVGLEAIPTRETIAVRVRAPQAGEAARREAGSILSGLGFYEAVTFTFCSAKQAALFLPQGMSMVRVDDARRGEEGVARPSVLTGLLACRRANQHARADAEGGVRLFEIGSVFALAPDGRCIENSNLALLMDVPTRGRTPKAEELQAGARAVRGVVESLVQALGGARAPLAFEPSVPHAPGFDAGAFARVTLADNALGYVGLLAPAILAMHDLARPAFAAELSLPRLLALYPPRPAVEALPLFPGIERDVSLILDERVRWDAVRAAVASRPTPALESWSFVGSFRGGPIPAGKKSVTVRLAFRDPARTLRHEEIDAPVADLVAALARDLKAEVRAG